MFETILQNLTIAFLALAALIILAVIWRLMRRGLPFRLFHAWMNLPMFGVIARLARLHAPTTHEADKRLDQVFRRYRKRIPDRPLRAMFDRARRYLFLSGDAAIRPIPAASIALLVALLAAESLSFAFLLGGRVWADASEDHVKLFAVLITVVVVALLAFFGHYAGGLLRRRSVLVEAWRHALDAEREIQGEKPMVELASQVSLNEDQERDRPRKVMADAQRRVNRVATFPGDKGKAWPACLYAAIVVLVAILQFELRTLSNVAVGAANLTAMEEGLEFLRSATSGDEASTFYANLFFVVIFCATQIFAVLQGFRHHFVGVESAAAFRLTGGLDDHEERQSAWDEMTRAADESLTNLLTRFKRFPNVHPDKALYLERVAREQNVPAVEDGDNDPPAAAGESNVTALTLGGGGK